MTKLVAKRVDGTSEEEIKTITDMRVACGWNQGAVPMWMEQIRRGDLIFYLFSVFQEKHPCTNQYVASGAIDIGVSLPPLVSREEKTGMICSLFTYHQRQGHGTAIVEFLLQEMFKSVEYGGLGLEVATMTTYYTNVSSPALFAKFGFREFMREDKLHWDIPKDKPKTGINYKLSKSDALVVSPTKS